MMEFSVLALSAQQATKPFVELACSPGTPMADHLRQEGRNGVLEVGDRHAANPKLESLATQFEAGTIVPPTLKPEVCSPFNVPILNRVFFSRLCK
jgi:hypothetical protein